MLFGLQGYVEQFDCLTKYHTAREAIEFSAALRLPPTIDQYVLPTTILVLVLIVVFTELPKYIGLTLLLTCWNCALCQIHW